MDNNSTAVSENGNSNARSSRSDEFQLTRNVVQRFGGYDGIAHSNKTYRRYERGVWDAVNELEIKKEVTRELEAAFQAGAIEPSNRLANAILGLLKCEVYVRPEEWNRCPNILVFENCALDTDAMQTVEHDPDHMATVALPYEYDPDITAPTWENVLHELLSEDEAAFFQEFAGYCLTPSVKYQMMLWLVGPPGGGKTTLVAGLEAMLDQLTGTLGQSKLQNSNFALSNIVGKTLLTCTESPKGHIKVTDTLNALVSGDAVDVEKKYNDAFRHNNTAKLLWAMNSLPGLYDPGNGMFRRVKILEIQPIPEEKQDPDVLERVKIEGQGIANWALEGLKRLNDRGYFKYPKSVKDASERFRKDNDLFEQFLEERCERPQEQLFDTGEFRAHASRLTAAFNTWASEHGHTGKWSHKALAPEWRRLRLKEGVKGTSMPERDSVGKLWYGVKVV